MLHFRPYLRLRAVLRLLHLVDSILITVALAGEVLGWRGRTPPTQSPVRDTLDRPTLASPRRAANPAAPANPTHSPAPRPPRGSTYSDYPRPRVPSCRSTTASPCASGASPDHAPGARSWSTSVHAQSSHPRSFPCRSATLALVGAPAPARRYARPTDRKST